MKCLDNCSNCIKDNGKDICKIAADDGIVKKIEPDDEVPDACHKKGYLIMYTFMDAFTFHGFGDLLDDGLALHLPLIIKMEGIGEFILRRLGALNENVLELNGINLRPGEEVTIDTDLLSVFFGYTEDVSSVTTDSVFFELSPGENDVVIDTNTGEMMMVTVIWQNRWL